jgi:membrane protein DedA with SNARE-associated domain
MKRFALADMVMFVVWAASTAYFVRIGFDLRRQGFATTDVVVGVGLLALLNVAVCAIVITLQRRIKAPRAGRPK